MFAFELAEVTGEATVEAGRKAPVAPLLKRDPDKLPPYGPGVPHARVVPRREAEPHP